METLKYTIEIHTPKQKVWEVMLGEKTYREWTEAFHAGSYFEGSWEEGSAIRFLALDDGKLGGMSSKIVKNIPYEYISIEHLGEIVNGVEDTTSEEVKQWAGAHENYLFSESEGVTTLNVELDGNGVSQEMREMFDGMWPIALKKLKDIVENSHE
jgi:hypothetical protein